MSDTGWMYSNSAYYRHWYVDSPSQFDGVRVTASVSCIESAFCACVHASDRVDGMAVQHFAELTDALHWGEQTAAILFVAIRLSR